MIHTFVNIGILIATVILICVNSVMIYQKYQQPSAPIIIIDQERFFFDPWFNIANKEVIEDDEDKEKEGISDEERDKIHKPIPVIIDKVIRV